MKRVVVVAALMRDPASIDSGPPRYLVQRRLPGGPRGGLWEFPGGKVEPGEPKELALVRECREELGVEISVGAWLAHVTHEYPDLFVDLTLYAATLVAGAPQPLGAQELRYASLDEMDQLAFCAADVPILKSLRETLR